MEPEKSLTIKGRNLNRVISLPNDMCKLFLGSPMTSMTLPGFAVDIRFCVTGRMSSSVIPSSVANSKLITDRYVLPESMRAAAARPLMEVIAYLQ